MAAVLSVLAAGVDGVLAQSCTPLNVTSGFNWDLVANGSGSAAGSVTGEFDPIGNVFYDSSYFSSHPGGFTGVLPAGSTVFGNSGNQYTLASASGNNALFLSSSNTAGTLNLSYVSPSPLGVIYVLGTSCVGATPLDYTLNFFGGVTVSGSFAFADWYDPGQAGEITGLGRVDVGNIYGFQGNAFSLYDNAIVIPGADQALTLQSISFTFAGVSSQAAVLAVSGGPPPVPEPGSTALLSVALAAVGWFVRRKP